MGKTNKKKLISRTLIFAIWLFSKTLQTSIFSKPVKFAKLAKINVREN